MSSCNSGGGSGSSAPAKSIDQQMQEATSATDYTASVNPSNFTVIKKNLSYEDQKERYTVGCKVPGTYGPSVAQIDPLLAVGQVFKTQYASSQLLRIDSKSTYEALIASKEQGKIVYETNFVEATFNIGTFTSIDQIFSHKPHVTNEMTYTYDTNGNVQTNFGESQVNYTRAAADYIAANPEVQNRLSLDCSVDYDSTKPSIYMDDKISYQLDGRNVVAFLQKRTAKGNITCTRSEPGKETAKFSMGLGTEENITIFSNELVSEYLLYCGGTTIFHSSVTVLDSGKVVSSDVQKVISAPAR